MTMPNDPTGAWQPPKRPAWVDTVNAAGRALELRTVVPLDPEELVATAVRSTGLSDFGSDDWREPFQRLVHSLENEADLHLMGRLLTRADLLRTLQGRLHIEQAYRQHPEIAEESIGAPLIITGAARTGTTALYNLLATDPDNRAPLLWETWFPDPPPETASYATDARVGRADDIATVWDRITPEFPLLHQQAGLLPVEDNYLLMFALRGPNAWLGKTPSYIQWLGTADLKPALDYAKRVLRYLQWKHQGKRWVLKSPALTVPLPVLFEAFPDAMLVYTHRDPVKLTASSNHLLNTVFWLRSDNHLAHQDFYKIITNDEMIATVKDANIDFLESGAVGKEQVFHLLYQDFVSDNVEAVRRIYAHFGIDAPESSFTAMTQHAEADAVARRSMPAYRYENPPPDTIARLRTLYGRYQRQYGIPDEI